MKRILCTIAAVAAISFSAVADEGMWLLPLLEKLNGKAMADLGCRLTPEQIYSINHSSIKDAVVIFGGGCTGEMISQEGLLVTNHHCGYGTIQKLSTPEHNYLEDGFFAMNRSEEIPAPGLSVVFLQSMTDVTDRVASAEKKGLEARDAEIKKIVEAAKESNPNCDATVTDFYDGNVFYLIVTKRYTDVRFVGAPPASSGKFGGETDNWMWPRHTCDFSMFRVYAGKDNEPAKYSEENVPFTPAQSLKVSLKGIKDGDFAMIIGYPGSTQRYQTAAQLQSMIDFQNVEIAARTVRQDIMWEARMADPVVNLQYASKYASSANGWKKWQGMNDAFAKLNVIERQKQKEAEFTEWVSKKKKRQEAYGGALDVIAKSAEERTPVLKSVILLSETVGRIEAAGFANQFKAIFKRALGKKDATAADSTAALEAAKKAVIAQFKDYSEPLDRKEAAALIKYYRENANPEELIQLEGRDIAAMDVDEYVAYLFGNTKFTSEEKVNSISCIEEVEKDPAAVLYKAISTASANIVMGLKDFPYAANNGATALDSAKKAYTAGLMEWYGKKPLYPDANFTMRLTYGSVKPYSPKDGVLYNYYTTLTGVMEKEDPNNYEFHVPAKLKEIYNAKDYGQYANEKGELVTCFLMTGDITGGNSGSPVMDADGNLIGLAFDGNWEAMSGDVIFEPNVQRCICVDIRYVLLMVDKFAGAGYLLDEMTLVK